MSPEAINGTGILGMSEQQPEAKDWLGEDIENSIGDDLSIHTPLASSISNAPNDWVKSPENESEASNGSKELGSSAGLGRYGTTTWDNKLIDDDQVCDAAHGVVSPLLTLSVSECSEETGENHDQIGDDGDGDVGTVHTGEESEIEKEERGGECPIDVTGPEDLTVDVLNGIWGVLVNFLDDDVGERVSVTGGHCEVGEGGKGGDQGGNDVEEAFLLKSVRFERRIGCC